MDNWRQELVENLDKYRLGSDDKFQFKYLGCGKCCKNREDIVPARFSCFGGEVVLQPFFLS